MKDKIILVNRSYLPEVGGIQQNLSKISYFLKRDYIVDILTSPIDGRSKYENMDGVNVFRKSPLLFFVYDYSPYDVVVLNNFTISPLFFACLKLMYLKKLTSFKGRIIFVPHGGFTPDWKDFDFISSLIKRSYHRIFGRFFINNFVDKIIAVSEWERIALVQERIIKNISIIKGGIEKVGLENEQKENYFVFVGRIDPIKNIEEIIETFSYIRQNVNFQKYALRIVGDYKNNPVYFDRLSRLTEKRGLRDCVEFLGQIEGIAKLQIIAKAQCLFCLSHMESDSLVIKEALSVKTKVFINTNYGLKDYESENNVFVKYMDNFGINDFSKFIAKPFNNVLKIPLDTWEQVATKYKRVWF